MKIPISFLLIISLIHPSGFQALHERNYYADELSFQKENWSWNVFGTLKTKWGTKLADDVWWFLTEDMYQTTGTRLTHIIFENYVIEIPKITAKDYSQPEAQAYSYRIMSYINDRQTAEVLKAQGNKLICLEPGAREPTNIIINNIHDIYPYIRVIETTEGWEFARP